MDEKERERFKEFVRTNFVIRSLVDLCRDQGVQIVITKNGMRITKRHRNTTYTIFSADI
jgi:hypothetical protein